MNDIYKNNGTTNMNDYYLQYIREKKNGNVKEYLENLKVPSNAMLPPSTSQLNMNQQNIYQQRMMLPANIRNNPVNNNLLKNGYNTMFNPNPNFYPNPNFVRNSLMLQQQMQMQNFLLNNNNTLINKLMPNTNSNMLNMSKININFQIIP